MFVNLNLCPCKDCLLIPVCKNRMIRHENIGPQVTYLAKTCILLESYLGNSYDVTSPRYDPDKRQQRVNLARKVFKLEALERVKY